MPASLVPADESCSPQSEVDPISGPRWSMPMDISKRTEDRLPMKVNVDLASLDVRTPAQEGITENVSPRGARILTNKPWKPNERLNVRSLRGNFRSRARVVYCVPVRDADAEEGRQTEDPLFAIGLQLFATAGNWQLPR